jgi:hypothetical protein
MTLMVGIVNHEMEQGRWFEAWRVLYVAWQKSQKSDE